MAQNGSIIDVLSAGSSDRSGRLIHNQDYRGGHFLVQTSTAAGTVTNVITVEGLVPGTTGTFYTVFASSAIAPADASITALRLYPGLSTAAGVFNGILPEWFRVRTTSATTGARTLRVHANLVI